MNPMLRDELAAILSEAVEKPGVPVDVSLPPVDHSPRARKMREAMRIANLYGWHSALIDFMGDRGATYLSDLDDDELDELTELMRSYVDAAEVGASFSGYLPAT